jgi:hypothetical protein
LVVEKGVDPMRTMLLGALVAALVVFSGDSGRAQIDPNHAVFMTGNSAHSLTLTRNGRILGTVMFPKGTWLSAVDEQAHPERGPVLTGRYEFHGTFELRALADQEVAQQSRTGYSGGGAALMSHAPLVLRTEGVDVLVETEK